MADSNGVLRRRAIYRKHRSLDSIETYHRLKGVTDQILQVQNSANLKLSYFNLQLSELLNQLNEFQSLFITDIKKIMNSVQTCYDQRGNCYINTNKNDCMTEEHTPVVGKAECCVSDINNITCKADNLSDDIQNNTNKTFENDPIYNKMTCDSSRRVDRAANNPTYEVWTPISKQNDNTMSESDSHIGSKQEVKNSKDELLKMASEVYCCSIPKGDKRVGFPSTTVSNSGYNQVGIRDHKSDRIIRVKYISQSLSPDFSDGNEITETENNINENQCCNKILTHEKSFSTQTKSESYQQGMLVAKEPHTYSDSEKKKSNSQCVTVKTPLCSRTNTAVRSLQTLSDTEVKVSQNVIGFKGQSREDSVSIRSLNINKKPIPSPRRQDQYSNPKDKSSLDHAPVRSVSARTRVKHVHDALRRQTVTHVEQNMDYDERECLANAFQYHITDLVKGIVFSDSELPDWLLNDECVTEDECAAVRNVQDRKDQVRMIVSILKYRDLRVLKIFLQHIGTHSPCVADKVHERFESNKRAGMKAKGCAHCNLKRQVNVKYVADHLWGEMAIEDSLYSKIIDTPRKVGDQNTLWREVIQSIGLQHEARRKKALERLLQALNEKGGLSHHVEGIQQMLVSNHDRLTCSCEPRVPIHRMDDMIDITSEESILPDSNSDSSRGSRF